jgi:hypothetical protein
LNEPIPGHGVFWSSAGGKSYPIPLRVLSFEQAYTARDPDYNKPAGKTFALELKRKFTKALKESRAAVPGAATSVADPKPPVAGGSSLFDDDGSGPAGDEPVDAPVDVMGTYIKAAFAKVANDAALMDKLKKGVPWAAIGKAIEAALPDVIENRNREAFKLIVRFLSETFGERDKAWETRSQPKRDGTGMTPWVYLK